MSEWKEVKIGDVCSVKRGASPRPIQNFMCKNGMPWVKIADATKSNSRYITSTEEYITEAGVPKSRIVTPGTLIVSNSATPGLPKIMSIIGCVHDGWLIIDDFNGVLKEYMYYKFIDIRRVLSNQANGSVFMNLKTDIVKEFPVKVPSIQEQEKIVAFLENIDDKIECNNKICTNLEAQAQALFKHWFVDFAPFKDGKFVESELGLIPEGWRVGKAEDFYTINIGKTPPRAERQWFTETKGNNKIWISISDMGSCGTFISDSKEYLTPEAQSKFNVVMVPAGTVLLSFKLTIGRVAIADKELTTNEAIARFILPNSCYREFTYLYLRQYKYESLGSTSSIATAVNSKIIKSMPLLMPTTEVLDKFSTVVSKLFDEINILSNESSRLATLRDTLLPKLMSGQIKV